jgi:hypothetical protein
VKAHAGSGKAVDNRGFDVRVAVGADGVGALVKMKSMLGFAEVAPNAALAAINRARTTRAG